ncbi:MAG: DUF998 domain-containing protein [Mucilaginibacter sp.]
MDQQKTQTDAAPHRDAVQIGLLAFGIIGSLLFNIIYFSFGAIAPNYDMLRQSISELQLLGHGWIQSANFIVFGLSVCALGLALRKEMVEGFGIVSIPLLHFFTAFGMIVAGIVVYGPVHLYALLFAIATAVITFLLLARRLADLPGWERWPTYTMLTVVSMLFMLGMSFYAKGRNGPYAGVFERFIVGLRLAWVIIFGLKLLWGGKLVRLKE